MLSAEGGHPGNDLAHAAIRRFTAPRAMRLTIASEIVHEPQRGDGIRYHVVSSRAGRLASGTLHRDRRELNFSIDVESGEHVDFIVDIGGTLAYDQFLWAPVLREKVSVSSASATAATWDAMRDFPGRASPPVQCSRRGSSWRNSY